MAIKISGTTVIDDSCNVTNANEFCATTLVGDGSGITGIAGLPTEDVLKPSNLSPSNGEENVDLTPTISGSAYISLFGDAHTCSCFQVSECSDFSTCNVFTCEIAGACTSLTVPAGCLSDNTQHFFRLRYEDDNGCCSDFSDATCFTTAPLPSTLGESICGGFYMGTICAVATGSCYYLIMAPNATGCAACQWKTTLNVSIGVDDRSDGYGNTYDDLVNATHPAGNWTATRSIGGFTDWYLPASNELNQLYQNCSCAPGGEGFDTGFYWSSSENTTADALVQRFSDGCIYSFVGQKTCTFCVRATRRVPFP